MYKSIKDAARGGRIIISCPQCGRTYRVEATRILTPGAHITCRHCKGYMVVAAEKTKQVM